MTAYPAQTTTGEVVKIERKYQVGTESILVATDGREFVAAKVGLNIIPRALAGEAVRAQMPEGAAAIVAEPAEPSEEAELKTEAELAAEAEAEVGTGDPMDQGGPLSIDPENLAATVPNDDEALSPVEDEETPAAEAAPEGDSENGEEADTEADEAA